VRVSDKTRYINGGGTKEKWNQREGVGMMSKLQKLEVKWYKKKTALGVKKERHGRWRHKPTRTIEGGRQEVPCSPGRGSVMTRKDGTFTMRR
jgi:hypothetical protein